MASKRISKLLFILVVLFTSNTSFGQIGINTVNPDTSAALDIQGTNKGILFPRTTQLQLSNIFQPATGLTLFQTDNFPGFYYNQGTSTTPNWLSVGMYHNANKLFWDKGNVGVGLSSPLVAFHIKSSNAMLRLEAGTGERAFMEFYADGPTTRSGVIGYITNGGPHFSFVNSRTNGDIAFSTTGTGKLTTNQSMTVGANLGVTGTVTTANVSTTNLGVSNYFSVTGTAVITGTATVTGNATVTNTLTVNNDVTVVDKVNAGGNISAGDKIQESGNDLLPAGVIVMWSGTVAPAGWALCNGSGGTPDLRNRFVVGSGSTYASASTGGATTHQHHVNPAAQNTVSGGTHSHTVNPSAVYASIVSGGTSSVNPGLGFNRIKVDLPTLTVTSHNGHIHSVDIPNTQTTSGSSLPPYYALAYIIKL